MSEKKLCRYRFSEVCKDVAETENEYKVPMCKPCLNKWRTRDITGLWVKRK